MNETPEDSAIDTEDEKALAELTQLPDETEADFLDRVRHSIRRRLFAVHVVDLCVIGSVLVLLQLIFVARQAANRDGGTGGQE